MTTPDEARADESTWQEIVGTGIWVHRRTYAVMRLPIGAPSATGTVRDPGDGEPLGRLELMGDPDIFQAITEAGRRLLDDSGERPTTFGSAEAAARALADPTGHPSIGATGPSSNDQPREF